MPAGLSRDAREAVEATLRILTAANRATAGENRARTLTAAVTDELGPPSVESMHARRIIVTLAGLVWTGWEQLAIERAGDESATELARTVALQITAGLDEGQPG